jgi:hypothetical protein
MNLGSHLIQYGVIIPTSYLHISKLSNPIFRILPIIFSFFYCTSDPSRMIFLPITLRTVHPPISQSLPLSIFSPPASKKMKSPSLSPSLNQIVIAIPVSISFSFLSYKDLCVAFSVPPPPPLPSLQPSLCRWFRFAQLAKGKKFRP